MPTSKHLFPQNRTSFNSLPYTEGIKAISEANKR